MDQRIIRKIDRTFIFPIPTTRYHTETATENWGGGYLAGIKAADNAESYAAGVLTVLEISGYRADQPWIRERVTSCRDINLLTLWISQVPTSDRLNQLTDFMPANFVYED